MYTYCAWSLQHAYYPFVSSVPTCSSIPTEYGIADLYPFLQVLARGSYMFTGLYYVVLRVLGLCKRGRRLKTVNNRRAPAHFYIIIICSVSFSAPLNTDDKPVDVCEKS